MPRCIDPNGYADGHDLRTDRVLSLFRMLQSCRSRQIDETDSILDIGCGPKSALPKFWNLTLSKILQSEAKYPQITGIDLETDSEPILPNGFAYLQTDINDWQIPYDFRNKFSLITSVYSWHWIMGGCDSETAQERATLLYAKVEELLQTDGRLAIQHLYTDDTMPEITKISIEALRRSGINQVKGITLEEYKERRAKAWQIPKTLPDVALSFSRFKETHPSTKLNSEYVAGSTSWHWKDVKSIWSFWKSVNLKSFFGDLSANDYETLERAFEHVLSEKSLGGLRLCSKSRGEALYVRITVKSAHEIIRKGNAGGNYRSSVILRPDLPNQVRARLAEQIGNLEHNEPWFGSEGTLVPNSSSHDEQTKSLLEVLKPILTCVNDAIARIFSINLRQVSITDGSNLGQMRNVGPANADAERIQKDGDWLRELKAKGVPTISEVVLSTHDNPPEMVVFVGDPWTNHRDWYSFNQSSIAGAKTGSMPSVVVLWVSAKNPAKLELFEPGNVVCADYLWEIAGWHDNPNIVDFLHFLIGQLRDDVKSTFLGTSNLCIEGDSKRRDSVSITTIQNPAQARGCPDFPEIADCFLIIDALQELALIGERIRSRQQGVKSLISASSHEQKQVVEFIFNRLLNQRVIDWFSLNGENNVKEDRMGSIHCNNKYQSLVEELGIIPSNAMINAARGFFGIWTGARNFLDDYFYQPPNNSVSLGEAITTWAINQAVGIAALTDIRTLSIQGFSDWPGLRDEWSKAVSARAAQVSYKVIRAEGFCLRLPSQSDSNARTKQIWFLRAVLAMISNALKNCPVEKIICQTECDLISHVVRITVINPLNYQDLKSPKANGEGTKAVLQLCADAFGGQAPRFNLCNEAGVDCPDSPDCNPTHWVAEVSFPFGINKGNTPWITRYTNSL